MAHDELEFVDWLRGRQSSHRDVLLGIGDDMARIRVSSPSFLLSSDMLLDGVHFVSGQHSWEQIGRKAVACSLSDCAAMAVRPLGAVVSLALPSAMSLADVQRLMQGMFAIAADFEMAIAGGDTARWDAPLAIDVAITARPFEGIEPVTRSGAVVGDGLFVTGPLGGSILGRHLDFNPRVQEAFFLASACGERLHAMIDVTDGLSLDLWRMCRASGVGAELDESLLLAVASDDAKTLSQRDGRPVFDHVVGDGEDFELLLAAGGPGEIAGVNVLPVGRVTGSGLTIRRRDGRTEPLTPRGYLH